MSAQKKVRGKGKVKKVSKVDLDLKYYENYDKKVEKSVIRNLLEYGIY